MHMTNKLKYLTKLSLDKKIKTKWFLIANIILLVIIAGIINIDSIIKFFGGDFDKKTEIVVLIMLLVTMILLRLLIVLESIWMP